MTLTTVASTMTRLPLSRTCGSFSRPQGAKGVLGRGCDLVWSLGKQATQHFTVLPLRRLRWEKLPRNTQQVQKSRAISGFCVNTCLGDIQASRWRIVFSFCGLRRNCQVSYGQKKQLPSLAKFCVSNKRMGVGVCRNYPERGETGAYQPYSVFGNETMERAKPRTVMVTLRA